MNRSAIIIPVHNRRAITLACLERLAADEISAWADMLVVDDGSTDGTAAAIRERFPSVEVLPGNGHLWWTGAIALGMRAALDRDADYILWLNDDTSPRPGALARLRAVAAERRALVSGTCVLPGGENLVVYGGLRRHGFGFDLLPCRAGVVEPCDAVSGNLVAFPAKLAREIGLPDARRFPQAIGDLDFALRTADHGWPVLVAHDAAAEASPNDWENHASWLLGDIGIAAIWCNAWRKRSYGYFPAQWRFFTQHWGARGAAHALWLLGKRPLFILIRLVLPQRWLRRVWGSRSVTWRQEERLRDALARHAQSPRSTHPAAGE